MKEWLLFTLFLVVGFGILITGLVNMRKEKEDPESVKIYRIFSIIGGVITMLAVLYRFLM